MKSILKSFLPPGPRPRRILSGLYRGQHMELDFAFETQIWAGIYEIETHAALRFLAEGAGAFIDIGAGSGELSLWFAKQHPFKPVLAFEPDPDSRSRMGRNLLLNFPDSQPPITIRGDFIDNQAEALSLAEAARGLPEPLFIKIDTEGAEARILESGLEVLKPCTARLLIEVHSLALERRCLEILHAWGYQTKIIRPAFWRQWIPEFRPPEHNQWIIAFPPS